MIAPDERERLISKIPRYHWYGTGMGDERGCNHPYAATEHPDTGDHYLFYREDDIKDLLRKTLRADAGNAATIERVRELAEEWSTAAEGLAKLGMMISANAYRNHAAQLFAAITAAANPVACKHAEGEK